MLAELFWDAVLRAANTLAAEPTLLIVDLDTGHPERDCEGAPFWWPECFAERLSGLTDHSALVVELKA